MKRLALAVAVVAVLTFTPAATGAVITGKYRATITSGFLKGKWTLNFFKKGSYRVTGPFGSLTGKSTFSGSTVTFSHESEGTMCPGSGKYRFKITGRKLKFTKIRESCAVRTLVTARTWTRVG